MPRHRYLVALGSNVRHPRHGAPHKVIVAAFRRLDRKGLKLKAASSIIASAPLGPSRRRYANAAAVVRTRLDPIELLDRLQAIEHDFGRRRRGARWRSRVLDLDIVLWDGGPYADCRLTIPHPAFRNRDFVLTPAAGIVPDWRDPLTGLTLHHLRTRLTRPRPHRT